MTPSHKMLFRIVRGIHTWPASSSPTPYEIFGMTPSTFEKNRLKSVYLELAKAYHPDRCNHTTDCQARFKLIGEAYSILKSDSKRLAWDQTHGPHAGPRPFTPNYPWPGPPNMSYNDPYDPDLDMKGGEERFRASLQENRHFILKVVVSIVALVGVMETTALFSVSDKRVELMDQKTREASAAHQLAFNNYDKGSTAQERIDRFLAQREYTLQKSSGDFRYSSIARKD